MDTDKKLSNEVLSEPLQQCNVKCSFFALYWNLEVAKHSTKKYFVKHIIDKVGNFYFLELKNLDNYTDEDAIAVEKIWRKSDCRVESYFKNIEEYENNIIVGRNLIKYWLEECKLNFQNRIDYRTIQHITDYLRSKGYALPFMQYSVDDLVKIGWVRLV